MANFVVKELIGHGGAIVGEKFGYCVSISVPISTINDWGRGNYGFLTLPLMEEGYAHDFIDAITEVVNNIFKKEDNEQTNC